MEKCLGVKCTTMVGSACGCCSPDFPEEYGYCEACYILSPVYRDKMQMLHRLLDGLSVIEKDILKEFISDFEEDHCNYYLKEVENSH